MGKPVHAVAGVATPESDARIRKRENERGWLAKQNGEPRENCPWDPNSMVAGWWFEGYDSELPPGEVTPQ